MTGIRSPPGPPLRWRPGMTLDEHVRQQKQSLRWVRWDAAVSSTEVDGDRPCLYKNICVRIRWCGYGLIVSLGVFKKEAPSRMQVGLPELLTVLRWLCCCCYAMLEPNEIESDLFR